MPPSLLCFILEPEGCIKGLFPTLQVSHLSSNSLPDNAVLKALALVGLDPRVVSVSLPGPYLFSEDSPPCLLYSIPELITLDFGGRVLSIGTVSEASSSDTVYQLGYVNDKVTTYSDQVTIDLSETSAPQVDLRSRSWPLISIRVPSAEEAWLSEAVVAYFCYLLRVTSVDAPYKATADFAGSVAVFHEFSLVSTLDLKGNQADFGPEGQQQKGFLEELRQSLTRYGKVYKSCAIGEWRTLNLYLFKDGDLEDLDRFILEKTGNKREKTDDILETSGIELKKEAKLEDSSTSVKEGVNRSEEQSDTNQGKPDKSWSEEDFSLISDILTGRVRLDEDRSFVIANRTLLLLKRQIHDEQDALDTSLLSKLGHVRRYTKSGVRKVSGKGTRSRSASLAKKVLKKEVRSGSEASEGSDGEVMEGRQLRVRKRVAGRG